jgi:hypothetical protein
VEFNRNHYFVAGLVLLLVGAQLRMVDSYILNAEATRMFSTQFASQSSAGAKMTSLIASAAPAQRRVLRPPLWLGYALMSIGSVLILHALAMPKPGGS